MTVETSAAQPDPPPPPSPDFATGEIEFLRLDAVALRRLSSVLRLVRHPFTDAFQEMRQRLTAAPSVPVSILVTSHRITFGDTTYVPANITSVTYHDHAKRLGCSYLALGCGCINLFFALCPLTAMLSAFSKAPLWDWGGTILIGVALVALGVFLYRAAKQQFSVVITTSGGGMDGFVARDGQTIQALHGAIQRSITVGE